MASKLAKAWRLRALMLPVSFSPVQDSICPAFDVVSLALGGMDGFPREHFSPLRKISLGDTPIFCYYCKNNNVAGFTPFCGQCDQDFDRMPEQFKFNYLFHIYPQTLLFASIKWH